MASLYEDEDSALPLIQYSAANPKHTAVDIVDDVSDDAQKAMKVEFMSETTYKGMSRQFTWTDSRDSYLDSWLEYYGRKLSVDPNDNKELEESVLEVAQSLTDHMRDQIWPASTEMKFGMKVLGIGSYYSRTKKSPADEFDFLCESQMRTDQLRFVHQPLPSTENTDFTRPDFFRIYDAQNQELKAKDWRNAFQQGLRAVLKSRYPDCNIECNGPALSTIIESTSSVKVLEALVKVDMTFGIPLDAQARDRIWPLDSSQVELDPSSDTEETLSPLPPRLGRIARCHFVPFGDFWRVSFAEYEGELLV